MVGLTLLVSASISVPLDRSVLVHRTRQNVLPVRQFAAGQARLASPGRKSRTDYLPRLEAAATTSSAAGGRRHRTEGHATAMLDLDRLSTAYEKAKTDLLLQRSQKGHWVGELSASALSTATAISTLAIAARRHVGDRLSGGGTGDRGLIDGGIRWILEHQNGDGGWGDTDKSHSNICYHHVGGGSDTSGGAS